jgi:hypothetical protein
MVHVEHIGEKRHAYWIFVGNPEGKRPLRRYSCRWEDNIITILSVAVEGVWIWEWKY